MTKHECFHEPDFQEIAEFKGMVKNELKNINANLQEIKAGVDEIRGKPPTLTKIWTILIIILVSMFGGVGAAKFLL